MQVKITRLSDRESRLLHNIERMLVAAIDRKPFSNREQPAWDLCEQMISDLEELRSDLLDGA